MYINDILNVAQNGDVRLIIYPYDTSIFASLEYGTASTGNKARSVKKNYSLDTQQQITLNSKQTKAIQNLELKW